MFGCSSEPTTRISSTNRASAAASFDGAVRYFTATSRPMSRSSASTTSPMPPAPSTRFFAYRSPAGGGSPAPVRGRTADRGAAVMVPLGAASEEEGAGSVLPSAAASVAARDSSFVAIGPLYGSTCDRASWARAALQTTEDSQKDQKI